MTSRALAPLARRFALMLGGEVAQSAFHFGLNVALARALSPHDYGRFAILFLVGGLAITYVRALAGVPAGALIAGRQGRRSALAHDVAFGSGAALLSALIGAGAGLALMVWPDIDALAGGLFVGLWCLRSHLRLALFAKRRAGAAGIGDAAFAISGAAIALWLARSGEASLLNGALVALAGGHALGIAASLITARQGVRISFGRHTRRRFRALWRSLSWSLVGVTTANVQGQGQSLLVALIAGPATYAPMAATFVLFAPLRLCASALINMAQPEIAGLLARGESEKARRAALCCAGLLALGCAAYGGVMLAALPAIESHVFAGKFAGEPMALIALLAWGIVTLSLIHAPARVLMETRREFKALAGLSAASAATGAAAVTALLLAAAPVWSLAGVALSEVVVIAACAHAIRPTFRQPRFHPG